MVCRAIFYVFITFYTFLDYILLLDLNLELDYFVGVGGSWVGGFISFILKDVSTLYSLYMNIKNIFNAKGESIEGHLHRDGVSKKILVWVQP